MLPSTARRSTTHLLCKYNGVRVVARNLNIHEYQSKELMDKYGVTTQKWRIVEDVDNTVAAARSLNAKELVVKAQIHAGGRGLGSFKENGFKGGVKLCKTPEEAKELVGKMLGNHLVTKQTGPDGAKVGKIMLAESIDLHKELYFAILMDRASQGPVMVASPKGGVDIEKVAEDTPDLIFKEVVDIKAGPTPAQTKRLAEKLGFTGKDVAIAQDQMSRLYELFLKSDATQVEINPFALTPEGKLYCVDAKINFDDNASFRQKDIFNYRDTSQEDSREVAASKHELNYIGMEGDIGCMVNGAGLAMATMDIIQLHQGTPANFLDVGGGANEKQVTEAFKILDGDKNVKAILVNIFGGIMKCDIIAKGILAACQQVSLRVPLVVRLAGTNVEIGKKLLQESKLNIITADDLDDAAKKAVAAIASVKHQSK